MTETDACTLSAQVVGGKLLNDEETNVKHVANVSKKPGPRFAMGIVTKHDCAVEPGIDTNACKKSVKKYGEYPPPSP